MEPYRSLKNEMNTVKLTLFIGQCFRELITNSMHLLKLLISNCRYECYREFIPNNM